MEKTIVAISILILTLVNGLANKQEADLLPLTMTALLGEFFIEHLVYTKEIIKEKNIQLSPSDIQSSIRMHEELKKLNLNDTLESHEFFMKVLTQKCIDLNIQDLNIIECLLKSYSPKLLHQAEEKLLELKREL